MGGSKIVEASPLAASEEPDGLVERTQHLAFLRDALSAVRATGHGRLVLVRGEAGAGKSALIRECCREYRDAVRILWGSCDALFTPRPLGPFLDIAQTIDGELRELLSKGALPHEVVAALMRDLGAMTSTILVIENVHWADEATLDVLRLLARRIADARVLALVSYRDDGLVRTHPLRILLGEWAMTGGVERLKVEPLSPDGVAKLAKPSGVDPLELHAKTAGNPFFVTEVLAAGGEDIPSSIRDAVLARMARLDDPAIGVLEAVAVIPHHAELWLLEELAGEGIDHLEACLASGMLTSSHQGVGFRHELARLAVEDSVAPNRRLALHRRALAVLSAPPLGMDPDAARVAHHAEAAGDAEAVLRFAPMAAARAASLGAHREAAAQYARALRFAEGASREVRADLLEHRAHENYLADELESAIDARARAIEFRKELGDRLREGDGLRSLAQMLWAAGRTNEAEEAARQSVALLESLPPGRELAMAYSVLASRHMNADSLGEAMEWGGRGLQLADELHDDDILAHALNTIGTSELLLGAPEGREKLHRSRDLAERVGSYEQVARALTNHAWTAVRTRSYVAINEGIDGWLHYCEENGLDLWRLHLLAYWAQALLDQGRWTEAVDSAALVLRVPRPSPLPRTVALVALGSIRARRGDPEVWACLDEARDLAEPTGELQRIAPVAAARAEALWLEGSVDAVAGATDAALALAADKGAPWMVGELSMWRRRAGAHETLSVSVAEPYSLQLAGEWARAAERWGEMGCPYEAAMALADGDDDDALRRALEELHRLGARAAAGVVTRRLRDRGARKLPRGPRQATRENPAGLTRRELEVLALLIEGLPNVEIARRLFVSGKTVDHHVSAVLRKLDVPTRGQARTKAVQLGLTGQGR